MSKKKKSLPKKRPAPHTDECFTIMPFGGWFDSYYDAIFCPAIEEAGLTPKRADDLYRPSAIVHDIWNYTKRARLILADLSDKNPNVFYELGLAHAIAKPAILVTQSMDDVPFDLRALRVIEYNKNGAAWGDELKTKITAAIKEVLAAPLNSVLPSFLEVSSSIKPSVTERQKEMIELRQEIELMRMEFRRLSVGNNWRRRVEGAPSPSEVENLVARYRRERIPTPVIIRRLGEMGVPANFVVDVLNSSPRRAEPEKVPADVPEQDRKIAPKPGAVEAEQK
jgi:hypothetical protein